MSPGIQECPNLVLEIVTSHEVPMRNTSTQRKQNNALLLAGLGLKTLEFFSQQMRLCFLLSKFCLNSFTTMANPIYHQLQKGWNQIHKDSERVSIFLQLLVWSWPGKPGTGPGHHLEFGCRMGEHRRGEETLAGK